MPNKNNIAKITRLHSKLLSWQKDSVWLGSLSMFIPSRPIIFRETHGDKLSLDEEIATLASDIGNIDKQQALPTTVAIKLWNLSIRIAIIIGNRPHKNETFLQLSKTTQLALQNILLVLLDALPQQTEDYQPITLQDLLISHPEQNKFYRGNIYTVIKNDEKHHIILRYSLLKTENKVFALKPKQIAPVSIIGNTTMLEIAGENSYIEPTNIPTTFDFDTLTHIAYQEYYVKKITYKHKKHSGKLGIDEKPPQPPLISEGRLKYRKPHPLSHDADAQTQQLIINPSCHHAFKETFAVCLSFLKTLQKLHNSGMTAYYGNIEPIHKTTTHPMDLVFLPYRNQLPPNYSCSVPPLEGSPIHAAHELWTPHRYYTHDSESTVTKPSAFDTLKKIDIYAAGITLIKLLCGNIDPFQVYEGLHKKVIAKLMTNGQKDNQIPNIIMVFARDHDEFMHFMQHFGAPKDASLKEKIVSFKTFITKQFEQHWCNNSVWQSIPEPIKQNLIRGIYHIISSLSQGDPKQRASLEEAILGFHKVHHTVTLADSLHNNVVQPHKSLVEIILNPYKETLVPYYETPKSNNIDRIILDLFATFLVDAKNIHSNSEKKLTTKETLPNIEQNFAAMNAEQRRLFITQQCQQNPPGLMIKFVNFLHKQKENLHITIDLLEKYSLLQPNHEKEMKIRNVLTMVIHSITLHCWENTRINLLPPEDQSIKIDTKELIQNIEKLLVQKTSTEQIMHDLRPKCSCNADVMLSIVGTRTRLDALMAENLNLITIIQERLTRLKMFSMEEEATNTEKLRGKLVELRNLQEYYCVQVDQLYIMAYNEFQCFFELAKRIKTIDKEHLRNTAINYLHLSLLCQYEKYRKKTQALLPQLQQCEKFDHSTSDKIIDLAAIYNAVKQELQNSKISEAIEWAYGCGKSYEITKEIQETLEKNAQGNKSALPAIAQILIKPYTTATIPQQRFWGNSWVGMETPMNRHIDEVLTDLVCAIQKTNQSNLSFVEVAQQNFPYILREISIEQNREIISQLLQHLLYPNITAPTKTERQTYETVFHVGTFTRQQLQSGEEKLTITPPLNLF